MAFYIAAIASLYAGLTNSSFLFILLITLCLLIVQVFTMPTCGYTGDHSRFMQRKRVLSYSFNDLFGQYFVDLAVCSVFYAIALFIESLKAS